MPLLIDMVTINDTENYQKVCDFAERSYQEDLRAHIHKFPPIFLVAITEKNEMISCLGLTPASLRNPLLIEKYFDFSKIDFLNGKLNNRNNFGEMGTFATKKEHRNHDFFLIFIVMFIHVAINIKLRHILLTADKPVQFILRKLGVPLISIGCPDKNKLSSEEQDIWSAFFRIKPQSFAIDTTDALLELQKKISQEILSKFTISPKLKSILKD